MSRVFSWSKLRWEFVLDALPPRLDVLDPIPRRFLFIEMWRECGMVVKLFIVR